MVLSKYFKDFGRKERLFLRNSFYVYCRRCKLQEYRLVCIKLTETGIISFVFITNTDGQCEGQTEFRNDIPLVNESVILTMDLSALSKPVSETKVNDKIVVTLIVFLSRPNRKLPLRT